MSVERQSFGRTNSGEDAQLYTLRVGEGGMIVKITDYGARITEWHVPDRAGKLQNVVLGFDNLSQYLEPNPYFGATVGRFANRIAKGRFTLDGQTYQLPINNGPNTLHGGPKGFDTVNWRADAGAETENSIRLAYLSRDGEQGFPGNLHASVTFTLAGPNELQIEYAATTDRATPVNLSNHSYFNLSGAGSGNVLDHVLTLRADAYTPVDEHLIPTGKIKSVRGTAMDFTAPMAIGSRIEQVSRGYDHNYVLNRGGGNLAAAAEVFEPGGGRVLEILTTQPGMQFYSGNYLDGKVRGVGGAYVKHGGFCLETQHFPDSVNQPDFPTTIVRPGEAYRQSTVYRFGTR